MKIMPKNTFIWNRLCPKGTIVAWTGASGDSEQDRYFLMESDADFIISELAGWGLWEKARSSDEWFRKG